MVRARAIGVLPDESATIVPIGGDTKIDYTVVPELDFTYFFAKSFQVSTASRYDLFR